jgi:hypothetical protein
MSFYGLFSKSPRCSPNDAWRASQPALPGMVPDLPDIGWREPPSAAVFDGISLVHEAAAISASAAYPSPAPIAAITARTASAAGCAITDRLRRRTLLDRMQRGPYNNV